MAFLTQLSFARVNSLLMDKLNDLADYLREDLVDALGTLQHDCVSPPEHEALENARFLLVLLVLILRPPNF